MVTVVPSGKDDWLYYHYYVLTVTCPPSESDFTPHMSNYSTLSFSFGQAMHGRMSNMEWRWEEQRMRQRVGWRENQEWVHHISNPRSRG